MTLSDFQLSCCDGVDTGAASTVGGHCQCLSVRVCAERVSEESKATSRYEYDQVVM